MGGSYLACCELETLKCTWVCRALSYPPPHAPPPPPGAWHWVAESKLFKPEMVLQGVGAEFQEPGAGCWDAAEPAELELELWQKWTGIWVGGGSSVSAPGSLKLEFGTLVLGAVSSAGGACQTGTGAPGSQPQGPGNSSQETDHGRKHHTRGIFTRT